MFSVTSPASSSAVDTRLWMSMKIAAVEVNVPAKWSKNA